ncbi:MAG: hypothetical protein IJ762_01925 [Bacteroidaceae bacterium]|nr:hypothetical protein [Bacteroidaceae bacterium]MBR1787939.1 hypothetical protein [Bacteroidaceae bacterium]
MKRVFLSLVLLLSAAMMVPAQSLLVGDANQDGELSIADVTKSVNMLMGKETQTVIDLNPYRVDNSMLVGTWQMGTERVTFRADGTTTYTGAATYKFRPWKGTLILNDADGAVVKVFEVVDIADDALVLREEGGTLVTCSTIAQKDYSMAALGDLFYSDGTFNSELIPGKTPIGVVAYVGTDAFSENGATLRDGTTTLQSHGLVLSLRNVGVMNWNPNQSAYAKIQYPADAIVNSTAGLKRDTYVSGYANTRQLGSNENYYACYATWNWTGLSAPSATTGWFIPTAQQWVKMLEGLGGLNESSIVWNQTFDSGCTSLAKWEAAMAKAGADGYDSMAGKTYWSSSEATGSTCVTLIFGSGVAFGYNHKGATSQYVRPVLAF